MKKNQIKKALKQLAEALKSERSQKALTILMEELSEYTEPELKSTNQQFDIPSEILGKTNAYAVFSDGACRGNPGPGSYGYMVQTSDGAILKEGSAAFEHTTNNKMELSGAMEGIRSLETTVTPLDEIIVYTDSKYVVDGMKSWVAGWKKRGWKKADKKTPENVELWKQLDELRNICNVSFQWIKGHAGHPQNEYVDNLANIELDKNGH